MSKFSKFLCSDKKFHTQDKSNSSFKNLRQTSPPKRLHSAIPLLKFRTKTSKLATLP